MDPYTTTGIVHYNYGYNGYFHGIDQNNVHTDQVGSLPNTTYFVASKTKSGYRNPKWKDQVRLGQNATTNFSGSDVSDDPGVFVTAVANGLEKNQLANQSFSFASEFYGCLAAYAPPAMASPDSSLITSVTNRCIRKFLDAMDQAQSSFEAGQDIGEYKETIESIHKPMGSLQNKLLQYYGALTKAKHKHRGNNVALKKALADTYLEFHFGWQPLVADIAKGIADCGRFRFPVIPVEGSASGVFYSQNISNSSFPVGVIVALQQNVLSTYKYFVRYKGAVRVRNLLPSGQLSWAQSLQLTPDKWLPTAWDLLPYSWVADYFVNIGEVIRGFSSLYSSLTWSCKTERVEAKSKFSNYLYPRPDPSPNWHWEYLDMSCNGGAAETWRRNVARTIISPSDLVPGLQFSVPHTKYAFANLGSLLLQRAKPLLPFFT